MPASDLSMNKKQDQSSSGPLLQPNEATLEKALEETRSALLSFRSPGGEWSGELSASALSTATAVMALALAQKHAAKPHPQAGALIERGRRWLAAHANADGGWGDTVLSRSNISTTMLVWAALLAEPQHSATNRQAIVRAERWLSERAGGLEPERLAAKILERYGSDRTFSAPILTHCALAGCLGMGPEAWQQVIPLPFELAALPQQWFAMLRLPMVSYALPALIAIGYVRHTRAPSPNPLIRALRSFVADRVFRVLDSIQPPTGGFLEAIPLTSFVVMSLAASGKIDHRVTTRGLEFLVNSAQADGSWKIDTNLSTWVTTLAIQALASGGAPSLDGAERSEIREWFLGQQYRARHPYTNAAPGGWAWTDLPGGVPDADDTAGALLALRLLSPADDRAKSAAAAGIKWLLDLQNRDGGVPTFCRGWGHLPFDQSSPDLTAHAVRAWLSWRQVMPKGLQGRIDSAIKHALTFLRQQQEIEGSWRPLWFGNESELDESNRVYGTSRVLVALTENSLAPDCIRRAVDWLVRAQKQDGGWSGGTASEASSVEETALAVEALSAVFKHQPELRVELESALRRGLVWLTGRVQAGTWTEASPIGFYFAKLWYFEKLYPMIFTVAALGRASRVLIDDGIHP